MEGQQAPDFANNEFVFGVAVFIGNYFSVLSSVCCVVCLGQLSHQQELFWRPRVYRFGFTSLDRF
jgi:hypothetical protein